MNAKQTKKLRQIYRRDVRDSVGIFLEAIREKPWYVPMFLYALILKIVFKPDAVETIKQLK